MLKVGITGGIGSGKTTVCQVFKTLGIPAFYADDAARYLMDTNPDLINSIKSLFGDGIYKHGTLDRAAVATLVFSDPEKLRQLNSLIHPATIQYAKEWMENQQAPYTIKEAAIFFESGSNKDMDVMIGVSAPLELRIQRAMQRGNATRNEILERIAQQMDEDKKMAMCDHIIVNDEVSPIIPQVLALHELLLKRAI